MVITSDWQVADTEGVRICKEDYQALYLYIYDGNLLCWRGSSREELLHSKVLRFLRQTGGKQTLGTD